MFGAKDKPAFDEVWDDDDALGAIQDLFGNAVSGVAINAVITSVESFTVSVAQPLNRLLAHRARPTLLPWRPKVLTNHAASNCFMS